VPDTAPAQFRHFNEALAIAAALARGTAVGQSLGQVTGYGYVLNMERLFESFVERSLALVVRGVGAQASVAQETRLYARALTAGTRSYYTRPDNVLKHGDDSLLLVDAKYKVLGEAESPAGTARPNNGDVYQLVASLVSHRCRRGLLLYPRMSDAGGADNHSTRYWTTSGPGGAFLLAAAAVQVSQLGTPAGLARFDDHLTTLLREVIERDY
jgi:5-methylcytosine-specific restriction endonuclease McrBC regulatory subunit McrC